MSSKPLSLDIDAICSPHSLFKDIKSYPESDCGSVCPSPRLIRNVQPNILT